MFDFNLYYHNIQTITFLINYRYHPLNNAAKNISLKDMPFVSKGAVFSSMAFMELCCSLFGTLTLNMIYAATIAVFRGFAYIVAGGFYLTAFTITL